MTRRLAIVASRDWLAPITGTVKSAAESSNTREAGMRDLGALPGVVNSPAVVSSAAAIRSMYEMGYTASSCAGSKLVQTRGSPEYSTSATSVIAKEHSNSTVALRRRPGMSATHANAATRRASRRG